MSSGKEHHSQNLVWGIGLAILLIGIMIHQRRWIEIPYVLVGLLAFLLANTYVTPDLDLWHSHPRKAWGRSSFIWAPFAWAVKHRSWKSHSLVVGTMIRLVYVLNLAWIIIMAALFVLLGPLYLLAFMSAILLFLVFISSLRSPTIWTLTLVVIINLAPTIAWCAISSPPRPWILSVIGGFIIGDAFHLIYDYIDSFYIGRPKKNGKPQGWRR